MGIPWSELATLIRVTDRTSDIEASREILQEGPLHRVVETVAAMPRRHAVAYPYRCPIVAFARTRSTAAKSML